MRMRKPNARWALAASVLCALQVGYVQGTVSASSLFSSKTPETYQSDLNSMTEAYPGELSGSNRIDTSTIRVVRRNSAEQVISDGLPTRIDADSMKYKGDNGDIDASGNVIIKKGNQVLRAPRVTGNVNTSEYTT
ncbi:MAG: organic solvent tolerance protein OstA, partial [Veillonella sp.]|nr:organic solvent tolerance protein OstA [Veillonella sp.]